MENLKMLAVIVLIGVLMTLNPASAFDDEQTFSGHQSGIYIVRNTSTSAVNGVVHIYKRINDHIGAYGLIHFKKNDSNACAAKKMIEDAILSNIDGNDQAKTDWKTFLAKTMKDVEEEMQKGAYKRWDETADMATIVVVVDGNKATQAKIFPIKNQCSASFVKRSPSFKERLASFKNIVLDIGPSEPKTGGVAEFTSKDDLLVMGTDFVWNKGRDQMIDSILKNPTSLQKAASLVTKWATPANENTEMDKGAIIIKLF